MEQPGARVIRPVNLTGKPDPNHLIIWLDKHIGREGQCALLKRMFFMIVDPTTDGELELSATDIDNTIDSNGVLNVRLDGVQFVLRAFHDPGTCYEAIRNNLDKRIFFITSGTKGEIIVPQLVANIPEKFVSTQPIYVFCGNMHMIAVGDVKPAHEWAYDYLQHLLMFDHQNDLLARLVADIADYFSQEAERLRGEGKVRDALEHYNWSKEMYIRSENIPEKPTLKKAEIRKVEECIETIEKQIKGENPE